MNTSTHIIPSTAVAHCPKDKKWEFSFQNLTQRNNSNSQEKIYNKLLIKVFNLFKELSKKKPEDVFKKEEKRIRGVKNQDIQKYLSNDSITEDTDAIKFSIDDIIKVIGFL